jgi:hypothetical protein
MILAAMSSTVIDLLYEVGVSGAVRDEGLAVASACDIPVVIDDAAEFGFEFGVG